MPPIETAHMHEAEKTSGDPKEFERQSKRPRCPRCGQLMGAVQTKGPITYYSCKNEDCGERARIPVARREVVDMLSGKMKRNIDTIDQSNVAARPNMKGT